MLAFAVVCALVMIFNISVPNELRGILFYVQVVGFVYGYSEKGPGAWVSCCGFWSCCGSWGMGNLSCYGSWGVLSRAGSREGAGVGGGGGGGSPPQPKKSI